MKKLEALNLNAEKKETEAENNKPTNTGIMTSKLNIFKKKWRSGKKKKVNTMESLAELQDVTDYKPKDLPYGDMSKITRTKQTVDQACKNFTSLIRRASQKGSGSRRKGSIRRFFSKEKSAED